MIYANLANLADRIGRLKLHLCNNNLYRLIFIFKKHVESYYYMSKLRFRIRLNFLKLFMTINT